MTVIGINEAAKILSKSPAALRNSYKKWNVPHFRIGGQIKFTEESLREWIENGLKEEPLKEKAHHAS
jgi:hypothetical protein